MGVEYSDGAGEGVSTEETGQRELSWRSTGWAGDIRSVGNCKKAGTSAGDGTK